jgi:hypothetical protein
MIMVKANEETEAGVLPSEELIDAMGRYTTGRSRSRSARSSRPTTSVRH